jgi:hypothetical protein
MSKFSKTKAIKSEYPKTLVFDSQTVELFDYSDKSFIMLSTIEFYKKNKDFVRDPNKMGRYNQHLTLDDGGIVKGWIFPKSGITIDEMIEELNKIL